MSSIETPEDANNNHHTRDQASRLCPVSNERTDAFTDSCRRPRHQFSSKQRPPPSSILPSVPFPISSDELLLRSRFRNGAAPLVLIDFWDFAWSAINLSQRDTFETCSHSQSERVVHTQSWHWSQRKLGRGGRGSV